jgi:DNA invertase Pin-like site-specific DNA recombinase
METKYVAYYRVSTAKQGESGLGLESQRAIVKAFVRCDNCIVAEYTEIESGKNNDRLQLHAAIAKAKETGAKLVIAKLDRLSRNVAFIAALMDSNIEFTCCDMPDANKFTIHIFAALAQQERELISARTKAALRAKKERGEVWAKGRNFTDTDRAKAAQSKKEAAAANDNTQRAKSFARLLRDAGNSYSEILAALRKGKFKTATGKEFAHLAQVQRLLQ